MTVRGTATRVARAARAIGGATSARHPGPPSGSFPPFARQGALAFVLAALFAGPAAVHAQAQATPVVTFRVEAGTLGQALTPVSYTHLTLPTKA